MFNCVQEFCNGVIIQLLKNHIEFGDAAKLVEMATINVVIRQNKVIISGFDVGHDVAQEDGGDICEEHGIRTCSLLFTMVIIQFGKICPI